MERILKLYTYVDGTNDTPFPSSDEQIIIGSFTYTANRMGSAPSITSTVKHRLCLDDLWNDKVYAEFNGEKYFVINTPSSSKSNDDTRYEHELELLSEREVLNHVYFIDAVQGDSDVDQYKSNSTKVQFYGNLEQFVGRLNASLSYRSLGYTAVIDDGITSEDKQVSFEGKYILAALQEEFNIFEIPYYFVGKVIHFGYTSNAITTTFKYGHDDAFLSISKDNANYALINRITGVGSSDNIPHYYPNETDDQSAVEASGKKWITPSQNLMPSIYRESEGAEMFYEAKNNTYPDGEGGYYEFENEYSDSKPREGITDFENIKPTITGITNAAGQRIDMFSEFAYDTNDNDEVDEEGNYLHPYFFAKLRKTDGSYGFNLFDQAIENQAMQISFTSGVCGACTFEIAVGDETQKNLVQVGDSGALMRDENGNVLCGRKDLQQPQTPQDRQNDTRNYEVWIALRKDDTTYPQVMPNAGYNYKPLSSDTFVILGINLPQAYILKAEDDLEKSLIKYMWMNNVEKFTFSAKFSRIFFTENPDVLAELNENARIIIEYNNRQHTLYISNYSYKMDSGSPLPEIDVDLVDTLSIGQNSLQTQLDSVKQDILSSIGGGDFLKQGLKYFLRKDKEDATNYLLRMLGGAHFFRFVQGMIGGSGAAFYKNAAGKVYMEADGAYLRDELIVPKITFNCIDVISGDKANTFAFGTIKSVDTDNKTAELDLLEDQAGTLHVDDICRGVFHNIDGGNQQDDMEDDNGFYGYAGFSTSYFTPTEIITNKPGRMVFRYSLQAGTSVHPMKGMNFFAYGNFTDKTRQSITYETRYYMRRLKDVNTWVIDPTKNISMQDGLLEGLTIGGMVMHGYGTFQENCYFTGVNIQFTPEIEDALKGQDAYNVSLSSYERTVKVDENGDLSSLAITTYIQAFKGETELLYSTSVEPGKYIASLNAHGCTAHIDAGSVIIDSITDYNGCYVDIEVNCEGNVVFNKTFSVSVIRDGHEGSSPVVIDLDNEMSSVACNAEGDIVAGLPVKSGVAVYKGTEALEISEVVAEAPEGVTCSVDEETHSVTVSAIGKEVAESFGITVTATADDDGVPVTRSTVMTILKVKAGENATLYRLVPSVNVIKIDKEGNYSESYVACSVSRINGKEMETLSALPEGFTMTVRKDGLAETAYSLNDDIVTSGLVRSVEFRLKKGDVLIDAETIPFVADGLDGLGSVTLDLDNEMASVACDAEGNVVNGLPITVKFSMYFGTEEMEITSVTNTFITGLVITNSASEAKSTITSISSSTPDTIELEYAIRGIYNSTLYERKAVFRILKIQAGENGKDGKNAIVYQLLPSLNVIKVNKNGSYVNTSILCRLTKNDGGTVSTVTTLPAGLQMSFEKDDGSETMIGIGDVIGVTNVSTKLVFRLYQDNVLADMETVPVVKDGQDGQDGQDGRPGSDGRPGADGADGKQGIQGCVIRTSIWTTGREYRNDSTIDDDSVIRYIDVAMVRNNSYSTGWRAYLCLRTHTSSSSIGVSNTTYWSEFSQNVTAILTDLIIAKNAQLQFMQGNRLLIQKDNGTITAGISGSTSGDKIRFWAGAEEPDRAPFRVDEEGNLIAQNGRFEGVIAGTLESLKTAGGEIDLDADKAWFNGIDLQNQGTVDGRPLRFYSSSIWCRNQFGAYGRIMARVLTSTVYYYPNGTNMGYNLFSMTAKYYNGQRYYSIPCYGNKGLYGTPDDIAGMPVDTIVLVSTSTYYYELMLGPTQRVFVYNANDKGNAQYIYVNGNAYGISGGVSHCFQAIPSAWMSPSVASSKPGANQMIVGRDINW